MTKKTLSIITVLIFLCGTSGAEAQLAKRTPSQDSANYQGLIRKNLALRKELRELEEKYMSLEDERKVLILHIKDLQTTRDATSAVAQDLKGKIAALRVEMLKDPKMVKTLDGLNKKLRDAQSAKEDFGRRVETLGKEKEKLFNELNVLRNLYNKEKAFSAKKAEEITGIDGKAAEESKKLAEELAQARAAFRTKEDVLTAQLNQVKEEQEALEQRNLALEEELKESGALLEKAQAELVQKIDEMKNGKGQKDAEARRDFQDKERALNDKIKGLEAQKASLEEKSGDLEKKLNETNLALSTGDAALKEEMEEIRQAAEKLIIEEQMASGRKEDELKHEITRAEEKNRDLQSSLDEAEVALKCAQEDVEAKVKVKSDGKKVEKLLAREVKELKGKVRDLDEEKKDLQYKLQKQKVALERSDGDLREKVEDVRRQEANRLAKAQDVSAEKEKLLTRQVRDMEKEKEDLAGKVRKLERADMEAQQGLLAQIEKMKEKNVALAGDLAQERTRVSDEASEMGKTIARLQVDLKEAQNAKGAIEEQMASDQVRVKELDGEVQWMQRERKKFNETLAELTKKIEDQEREAKYDKQFLEQKVKNAKADRMMFETKFENLKKQTTESEAKFRAAEDGLKMSAAQSSLQESQIIVLREEKSKLERKLIRYISKIIDDDDAHGKAGKKKAAGDGQASLAGEKMQTKEEIAEQKLKLHYNLALAYDRRGMYKKEEREYIKCLKINPNDANVHYNLAILYDDKLNYNNKAVKHYEIFLKLRPSGTDVEKVKDWMLYAEQEDRLGAEMK